MNPKKILKICTLYYQLCKVASDENISFEIKMANELNKNEIIKLDELTLHSKSMMSSFIQKLYFGALDTPAVVAIAKQNSEYIGWSVLQLTEIKEENKYVKSIDVFVRPEHREKGIGSKLVNILKEDQKLIPSEINGVPVESTPRVGAWDEPSRKFFQKHELKGDILDPVTQKREKYTPVTELDKMFEDLGEELQISAQIRKILMKLAK